VRAVCRTQSGAGAADRRGRGLALVEAAPLSALVGDWAAFLAEGIDAPALAAIRAGERTGRPLGDARFVAALERDLGRTLARQKPGRKPKVAASVSGVSGRVSSEIQGEN